MKFKTTKKAITGGFSDIVCVGYCDLQHLLKFEDEIAYTVRAEGWGADIYKVGNTAIVTGYAPFGNIRPGYEINRKFDEAAKAILSDWSITWQEHKEKIRVLLDEYIVVALGTRTK